MSYITQLTIPPPSRGDSINFAARADITMTELPIMVNETNIVIDELNALHSQAADIGGADTWVPDTTYSIGDLRISTINLQIYSRITIGGGVVDPSLDPTNWTVIPKSKIVATQYSHIVTFPTVGSGLIYIDLSAGTSFVYDGSSPHYWVFRNLPDIATGGDPQQGCIFELVIENVGVNSLDVAGSSVQTPSGWLGIRTRSIDDYTAVTGTIRVIGVVSKPGYLDLKLVRGNW